MLEIEAVCVWAEREAYVPGAHGCGLALWQASDNSGGK